LLFDINVIPVLSDTWKPFVTFLVFDGAIFTGPGSGRIEDAVSLKNSLSCVTSENRNEHLMYVKIL
jgi:hypothetical protein